MPSGVTLEGNLTPDSLPRPRITLNPIQRFVKGPHTHLRTEDTEKTNET